MDKEQHHLLDEIIQHRKKYTELLQQSIKTYEQAKDVVTFGEKLAAIKQIIEIKDQAYQENKIVSKLSNELHNLDFK